MNCIIMVLLTINLYIFHIYISNTSNSEIISYTMYWIQQFVNIAWAITNHIVESIHSTIMLVCNIMWKMRLTFSQHTVNGAEQYAVTNYINQMYQNSPSQNVTCMCTCREKTTRSRFEHTLNTLIKYDISLLQD